MATIRNLNHEDKEDDFYQIAGKLISEQKYGAAINYLRKIIEADSTNKKAVILLEQINKIMEYQNLDVFSSTNLQMDPWFE